MQFRKLVALGGAALMTGMSFAMPALAAITNVADIGTMAGVSGTAANFPTFIVGADAKTSDVAAAINLASYMAGNVYTTSSVSTAGSAAGADGVTLRMQLGYTLASTKDFDLTAPLVVTPPTRSGRSASFLMDTTTSVSSTTYNYYEQIEITQAPSTSTYNLTRGDTSTSSTYETAKKDIGVQTSSNDIKYRLMFDTALPYGTNLTGQTMTWMGQTYTITGTPTAAELRLSPSAGGQFIAYQQSAMIAGYTIKVIAIGTLAADKVGLEVSKGADTQTVSLAAGESKTVTLGGTTTTIGVSSTITGTGGGAQVTVGTASMVLKDGQEIKDTSGKVLYPNWIVRFGISAGGGAYAHFNLTYSRSHTSFTGDTPALTTGTGISAPTGYFGLKNVGPEQRSNYKLVLTAISQSDLNGDPSTNENGIKVELKDPTTDTLVKVINAGTAGFVDTVAWDNTHMNWYYSNSSGQWQLLTGAAVANRTDIPLQEGTLYMTPLNASGAVFVSAADGYSLAANKNITLKITEPALSEAGYPSVWWVEFQDGVTAQSRFADIGAPSAADTYTYLAYGTDSVALGDVSGANIKARSAYTSSYGTAAESLSQSQVTLAIPKVQNYWDVVFGREAGSSSGGSVMTKTPVRITGDVAMLDTEVSDFAAMTSDMVVMGGPAINKAAATLLGVTYPAHGASSGITADTAMVKVFQNAFGSGKVALLVAGYEAANTDMAVAVIQAGRLTQTVPKVQISGTVSSPVIEAVA